MPRESKKEKMWRMIRVTAAGLAVGLVLVVGINVVLPAISGWLRLEIETLSNLLPRFSVSLPLFEPQTSSSPLSAPTFDSSSLSSATFTEIFGGNGFEDVTKTNAYEDYSATAISLVPDFTVSSAGQANITIPTDAAFSGNLSGRIRQTGGIYTAEIPAFPDLVVTSTYPGILRFGYDPETKKTLVIYAAYMSRVLEMGPGTDGQTELLADYSARFGPWAFGGGTDGELAVDPIVFPQDGAWWIFSGNGSTEPKLMKIQNGAVIDYTETAFPNEGTLRAAPGPAAHEIYVVSSSGSYFLTDRGFKQAPVQWVSTKLNYWKGNIVEGEITSVEGSEDISSGSGAVQYFLSNDGGATWIPTTPGEQSTFPGMGGDFRYKVVISPSADVYTTPWVNIVRLEYWLKRSGQ